VILITGGTGHIGNVLVRELLALGEKARVLVLPGEDLEPLQGLDVEIVQGDVLQPATLERALENVEMVYHLAGIISIMPRKDDLVHQVNVEGTRNLLQAARGKVRRLVYTSSIHALGRPPHGVIIDESLPFDPENTAGEYDRSKAQASLMVLKAAREGMDAVIVCPTGVIGPYDFRESEVGRLISGAADGKPQYWLHGGYDFVDVRDVARGMILACRKGRSGETYILGCERISIKRIYETIVEITGIRAVRLHIPTWLARLASRVAVAYYRVSRTRPIFTPYSLETVLSNSTISWAKASRELGYSPRSLRESIADTIEWMKAHKRPWRKNLFHRQ